MNIIKFVIQRKTFVSMFFIGICLLGFISYKQLPVELLPNAELPMLFVQVRSTREVDPDYFERKAIVPLEGAIGTLENIDRLESRANRNSGNISVYYNEDADVKYAYLKLTERVNSIRASLPEEFVVTVMKIDMEQISNMLMSLEARGSGGIDRVRTVVDEKVTRELENIEGIATVEVTGGRQRTVTVTLNDAACEAQGITPAQIRSAIALYQENKRFLGYAHARDKKYFVNISNEYTTVSDLENVVLRENGPIRLKDVSDIFIGSKESETISRVNGLEAVTISLVRDSQVNMIAVAHETRKVIAELNKKLMTDGVELVIQEESDNAKVMESNIDLIMQLALVGGILAILVLWFFLKNIRLVVIVAVAIPISILAALNFFYAFDISLNSLTLVGMALAVGMLLDNSIVVLENIYRLVSPKKDLTETIIQGTQEVWRSIFAATLTTITVFLPFVFSSDFLIQLMGKHISVSIISTLLMSLVVALLLIPMIVHWILRREAEVEDYEFNTISQKNRFVQIYTLFLKFSIRYPARTIIGTVVVFFLSIVIVVAMSISTQEEVEVSDLTLYLTMPQGSTLEKTDLVVADVESKLKNIEEGKDVISKIYEEEATITITMKDDFEEIKDRTIEEIKRQIQDDFRRFPAADISFTPPESSTRFRQGGGGGMRGSAGLERMMGMGSSNEKVVIKGTDFELMHVLANDIRAMLDNMETIDRTFLNIADDRPEMHLLIDNQAISHFDVSLASIQSELAGFNSETSSGVQFKIGNEEYDIIIKKQDDEDKTIDDLRAVTIPSNSGGNIDLHQLSQLLYTSGASGINRINQEKEIEVGYNFISDILDSKELLETSRLELDQIIASLEIPPGIAVEVVHDETEYSEYYFLIGTAFILIYMILASVFESLSLPVVMMFTIPLAAIGSFWALIFTGNSITNSNVLIGFLILLGIVVNNGIILIDYTRILRDRGYSVQRALLTAGQARLRPILITTITTIVAMFPLAMGQAEYVSRIGAPFAITVIGGLSLSAVFTLIFIPTVYSGLESAIIWWQNLSWKIKVVHAILTGLLAWLIYENIDSLLWQFINMSVVLLVIPAATYFIQVSLRRASEKLIAKDESIKIQLRHLVKIYDSDSQFVREWKAGKDFGGNGKIKSGAQFWIDLAWKLPLLGFLIYFVYFYLSSGFWTWILCHAVYFYSVYLIRYCFEYLKFSGKASSIQNKESLITNIFLMLFPLVNVVIFHFKWNEIAMPIIVGILWYLALLIYFTANRLHKDKVKIDGLTGRFVGLRRNFYLLVRIIPIIGRRKQPFAALKGVTFDIGSGMFGLLGPNGAGKTTLMRLICGILEANRGTITINGIKLAEKREELQGLIGYLPQEFGTYENMEAEEFLDYQAMLKGIWEPVERKKIVDHVLAAVHLEEKRHGKIGSFSGGMRQRVGIAQTLLHLPRILVVDEPTAGLDPRERIRFRNLLVELSKDRIVIFSTHIIEDISSSCNALAVLDKGELQYLGSPEEMAKQAEGYVWQVLLAEDEFERVRGNLWVVHHIRDENKIRVRFLAPKSTFDFAENVRPSLEDAYLWMLGKGRFEIA